MPDESLQLDAFRLDLAAFAVGGCSDIASGCTQYNAGRETFFLPAYLRAFKVAGATTSPFSVARTIDSRFFSPPSSIFGVPDSWLTNKRSLSTSRISACRATCSNDRSITKSFYLPTIGMRPHALVCVRRHRRLPARLSRPAVLAPAGHDPIGRRLPIPSCPSRVLAPGRLWARPDEQRPRSARASTAEGGAGFHPTDAWQGGITLS